MIAVSDVDANNEKASENKRFSKFDIGVYIAILLFLIALVLLLIYPGYPALIFYFITSIPIIVIFIHYYIKRKKKAVYGPKL